MTGRLSIISLLGEFCRKHGNGYLFRTAEFTKWLEQNYPSVVRSKTTGMNALLSADRNNHYVVRKSKGYYRVNL